MAQEPVAQVVGQLNQQVFTEPQLAAHVEVELKDLSVEEQAVEDQVALQVSVVKHQAHLTVLPVAALEPQVVVPQALAVVLQALAVVPEVGPQVQLMVLQEVALQALLTVPQEVELVLQAQLMEPQALELKFQAALMAPLAEDNKDLEAVLVVGGPQVLLTEPQEQEDNKDSVVVLDNKDSEVVQVAEPQVLLMVHQELAVQVLHTEPQEEELELQVLHMVPQEAELQLQEVEAQLDQVLLMEPQELADRDKVSEDKEDQVLEVLLEVELQVQLTEPQGPVEPQDLEVALEVNI